MAVSQTLIWLSPTLIATLMTLNMGELPQAINDVLLV